ncbi:Uncharacterised protein [Achromobacter xylosoxidans]|jgi:hypothetical protein|nr:Uncharacterised protein [Achromobacter xylosoxidans]CUR79436.1 hypothetical protein BN2910_27430 [Achromobacter xylosoxidans]
MRVRPAGRIIPARLATGKKNPPIVRWGDFFARPPYFLAGAAVMAVANSSVMLK